MKARRAPIPSCLSLVLCLLLAPCTMAQQTDEDDAETISKALTKGKVSLDARYRLETVDEDGFDENAVANTLRLRLNYETLKYHGFFAFVGLEGNISIGSERYNSTANGKGEFPIIPDPQDAELDQGYLGYHGLGQTTFKLGRQVINLDNQRYVGAVAFRQLQQTFDAFRAEGKAGEHFNWFYAHVNRAVRIFGEHNPNPALAQARMSTDLVNLSYGFKPGKLTAYAYLLDSESFPTTSQKSLGLRFGGATDLSDRVKLLYTAEYADQSPYKDGDSGNDADYLFGELGVGFKGVTARLGYEQLGGDGDYAFQTPLATLHKFNGWADKFAVATPADGLQDIYVSLAGEVAKIRLGVIYHDFSADNTSASYGDEWDFLVARSFGKMYHVALAYAIYSADTFSTDTNRLWLSLGLRF